MVSACARLRRANAGSAEQCGKSGGQSPSAYAATQHVQRREPTAAMGRPHRGSPCAECCSIPSSSRCSSSSSRCLLRHRGTMLLLASCVLHGVRAGVHRDPRRRFSSIVAGSGSRPGAHATALPRAQHRVHLRGAVRLKYFDFFNETVADRARDGNVKRRPALQLLLDRASFHTFQSLSYVIEGYERRQTAERDSRTRCT